MTDISRALDCSLHKVAYWMTKHNVITRSWSDAAYLKYHPNGDPFAFRAPRTMREAKLFGLGIGLYWGEGTKANKYSVRLGNTDPQLLGKFIQFLEKFFQVRKSEMRFGLQIFSDIDVREAMDFWLKSLKIKKQQFYKPTVTISGSIGTYRKKSQYGILTVLYNNKKLRNLLVSMLPM
ncbi:MAG: hypothetical protein HY435_01680 [Candidatus Liptonbacteria bacterium]|nr:hypothetical protein [Candidatus Liptonbacteria bacterium]